MTVKHPSYLKIGQINTIIESLLSFNNIDPYTYHRSDEPFFKPPKAKRPKNVASEETVADNESVSEEVEEGEIVSVVMDNELVVNAAVQDANVDEDEVAIPFSNF